MQPCSREMQGMNSMLNPSQVSLQDLQTNPQQIQNPQIQVHNSHFDTPSHDDFLEQMFSTIHSNSWPELSHPNPKMLSDETGPSNPESVQFPYDDQSAILASKLRQHQISGDSATAAAAKMLLQQQMMMQMPLHMNGDGSFKSPHQGGEGSSMQALYNGYSGSLHGAGQTPNPTQHFQHPQGGAMHGQSFSAPSPAGSTMNQSQASGSTTGAPQQPRQRVRARRGQATDPHSIAERLRRERIAERMKALQELVPNANKTDKASMLDEIIDYVKFLQLQVKVLSMSRLGGAAAVAPLVADISSEGQGGGSDSVQANGAGGSSNGSGNGNDSLTVTEQQVAKLMEEDMGQAMQYLQGKGLCLMPISLATAISTVTSRNHRHPLQSNGAEGPSSPSMSVLTVQSAAAGNGGGEASAAKDAASVSKP